MDLNQQKDKFLRHEPCPNCGSKDNLAVYGDGHCWCFGCHHYVPAESQYRLKALEQPTEPLTTEVRGVWLPEDSEPYYPFKCLEWIKQYELSENDLRANQVVWSESKMLLIFPYKDEQHLLAWQGRNFGDVYSVKWFGRGNLEDVFIFKGPSSRSVILVEDILSAIKIGKAGYFAMPVFGSNVSAQRLLRLKILGVDHLTFWLDADKIKESHKFCKKAQMMGFEARTIYTEKDPKTYSSQEIKEIFDKF